MCFRINLNYCYLSLKRKKRTEYRVRIVICFVIYYEAWLLALFPVLCMQKMIAKSDRIVKGFTPKVKQLIPL
jgi:hypothetical protein